MARIHFAERCKVVPKDIRMRLQQLFQNGKRATAGKDYWEDCLRAQGVYEDGQMLRFKALADNDEEKEES